MAASGRVSEAGSGPQSLRPGLVAGGFVDRVTAHRWAIKVLPVLAAVFRRRKHPVGRSWRMDEAYIKVSGQWKYLYRTVDGPSVRFV